MILLKGFIRYKSSKTYLIIFTALLITITILFNFISYYSNIITKTYQENSYFLIISDKDNYGEIKAKDYIVNLEIVILLEPEYSNIFLDNQEVTWSNLFDLNNNFMVAISNKNDDVKLADNQISFGLPKMILENFNSIYNLEMQKTFFQYENNKVNFELIKIYESHFSRILISNNTFQNLLKNRNSFSYIFSINDYDRIDHIVNSLNKIKGVQKVIFNQTYKSEASFNTVEKLKSIISILNFASRIVVVIFLILFLIVTNNIVSDELQNMSLERLLGYNKHQIKIFLIMKIITLNLAIIFFSTTGYIFINTLIKTFLKIGIDLFDTISLLKIYIILLSISISFCLFSRTKSNLVKGLNHH